MLRLCSPQLRSVSAFCSILGNFTVIQTCFFSTMPLLKASLNAAFDQTPDQQATKVYSDATCILQSEYQLFPSGKCYRIPASKLNQFKYACSTRLNQRTKSTKSKMQSASAGGTCSKISCDCMSLYS